jgi:hypothetical protein
VLAEYVSFCKRSHIWTDERLKGPSNIWISGRLGGFIAPSDEEGLKAQAPKMVRLL